MVKTITFSEQNKDISFTNIFLTIAFYIFFTVTASSQIIFDKAVSDWSNVEVLKQNRGNKKIEMKIFPNPVKNNIIHLQFSKTTSISTIKIYDILGKEVFIKRIESFENTILLRPNLSEGVYIIKLNTSEKGSISKKIIIE